MALGLAPLGLAGLRLGLAGLRLGPAGLALAGQLAALNPLLQLPQLLRECRVRKQGGRIISI